MDIFSSRFCFIVVKDLALWYLQEIKFAKVILYSIHRNHIKHKQSAQCNVLNNFSKNKISKHWCNYIPLSFSIAVIYFNEVNNAKYIMYIKYITKYVML